MIAIVYAVINGYLNDVEVSDVAEYEEKLYALLEGEFPGLLERLEGGFYDKEDEEGIKKALERLSR